MRFYNVSSDYIYIYSLRHEDSGLRSQDTVQTTVCTTGDRGFVCVYISLNFVLVQFQHGDVSHDVKYPRCKARTSRCLTPS